MKNKSNKSLSMQEIQAVSFEILKTIKKVCEKLDLKYTLAFGTLLGAIRHKGYIPWDDDVDILIPRPDFNKLVSYFELHKEELYPYEVWNRTKHPDYPYALTRIIDKRYTLEVQNEKYCGMGIFVDIYVLDGAGNTLQEARNLLKKSKFYPSSIFLSTRKHLRIDETRGIKKILLKPFFYTFVKLLGTEYFLKRQKHFISAYDYDKYPYVACLEWGSTTASAIAKKDLENTLMMDFNGEKFPVLGNFDMYLEHTYGDYLSLPPEKDRVYHHLYKAYRKSDL